MFKDLLDKVNRFIEHSRFSGIVIAVAAFFFVFLFSFSETYDIFELKLYDLRFKAKPQVEEWDKLTFVDIDEVSLLTVGQFPWPRIFYGKGFKSLKAVGASQIALDIMFPDKSPINLDEDAFKKLLVKAGGRRSISSDDVKSVALDNDLLFSKGVSEYGNVILSYTFDYDDLRPEKQKAQGTQVFARAEKRFIEKSSIPIPKERAGEFEKLTDSRIKRISYPIPELMNTGKYFGFVHRDTDIDGVIRKIKLFQVFNGRIYFNIALAMYIDACKITLSNVEIFPGDRIVLKKALNHKNQNIEDIEIPIDRNSLIYINWAGPGPREKSFKIMPFYSLLEYVEYAPVVAEFFDDKDSMDRKEKGELKKLKEDLVKEKALHAAAKDSTARIGSFKKISSLRKDIEKIKWKFYNELKTDVDKKKKEQEKTKDGRLKEELEILQDDLRAIELVIKVESLADQILLTGLTATGTHDLGAIPVSSEYARVGIYHNTINTIHTGNYIRKVPMPLNYVIMLALAIILGFVIQRLNAKYSIITIIASFIAANMMVIMIFAFFSVWVNQLGIILSLLLPSITISAVKFLKEESQKKFIKNAFSRYLTPGVIDEIIKHPESLELGGVNKKITIFFSDVAGFSSISEKLTPQQLVGRLNEYLSEMTDIILGHGGTIDKYEGDAIMAFYGAPFDMADSEVKACYAAIDMKRRLRELQEVWKEAGKDVLSARMGMNTGTATVGNMGSKTRMDYTAMGDSVNLASRLEGANKFYSTGAMISQSTYDGAKDFVDVRKLDTIRVVGKLEAVVIYELLGKKGTLPERMYELIDQYNQGLNAFSHRDWKKAKSHFSEALKVITDDGPSLKYLDRCNEYLKTPPPKKWDGIYSLKSK